MWFLYFKISLLKQDVLARCWTRCPRHVSTTFQPKVKYFVSQSWKISFMREITEDFIEDMIHVACAPRGVCFQKLLMQVCLCRVICIKCPKHFRKHYICFQNIVAEDTCGSTVLFSPIVHQAHAFSDYIKEDSNLKKTAEAAIEKSVI